MRDHWFLWWLVGLAGIGLLASAFLFNPDARLRRRLRKTHSRIVSRARKPTVRFSVRAPKEKKKKKS